MYTCLEVFTVISAPPCSVTGPGAIEAIANGCVYIQPRFPTPISRSNHVSEHLVILLLVE